MCASAHSGYDQYAEKRGSLLVFLKISAPKILGNSRGKFVVEFAWAKT